jgi:NADPH-dependent glutamate synthase beta subunit-like oxidoreductase
MLSELRDQGFASVFLGIGAYESRRLGLAGEQETQGVMSGVDYLGQVLTGARDYTPPPQEDSSHGLF